MRVQCTLLCTFNHWTIMPESTWLRYRVAFSAAWAGLVSSHQNWPGLNINNSNNNGHWTSEHGAVVRWWRLQLGHNRLARVISYYWYRLITRRWWAACAGMTRLPIPAPASPRRLWSYFPVTTVVTVAAAVTPQLPRYTHPTTTLSIWPAYNTMEAGR